MQLAMFRAIYGKLVALGKWIVCVNAEWLHRSAPHCMCVDQLLHRRGGATSVEQGITQFSGMVVMYQGGQCSFGRQKGRAPLFGAWPGVAELDEVHVYWTGV